ncbi:MAG: exodeoxyribonuclease VII large subunit [Pseudomonadales bacterium]|nr:exodeoxyribonuclease VII large subunit [Pseudomonadales bacterium]
MSTLYPPGFDTATQEKPAVLSVSSLNRLARSLLEGNFPAVRVEGEISNLAQPGSGHWYLSLKDSKAQLRCAMFANRNRQVRFRPANGQQVIVSGRLSIYEARGDYQLIVDSMEAAGDGALQRAFEALKAKLDAEGLFAEAGKQPVGNKYRHIGIITSPTGAAIRDLLSVFKRRFPAIQLTLFPVSVQGQQAADEIVAALASANRLADKLGIEALILGRGGGSLEDLQAFNEESVARAIHASKLPVTSAVGHEIDFSIADFVADLRAPTPSAAAELMSPSQDDYREQLLAIQNLLEQRMRLQLRQAEQQLKNLLRHLTRPDRRLQDYAQTLDRLETRLLRAQGQLRQGKQSSLEQLQRRLTANSPRRLLDNSGQRLERLQQDLQQAIAQRCKDLQSKLAELSRGLHAVSPLNTLARGYSLTWDSRQRLLRDSSDVAVGDEISTRLARGSLQARVIALDPAEDKSSES